MILLDYEGYPGTYVVMLAVADLATVIPSLLAAIQGLRGLAESRELPPPSEHRAIRRGKNRIERLEKPAEKQLLEVIEANGEITPARAALQTSITVEEAEQLLSDLAQKGYLNIRVAGNQLVYSL